mmetsp:Transcript_45023/g.119375  ORF Transcript_45023/g.119375 Transcript_45023/m.119375 type:complete len:230 (+) Transcript_45023:69-758(+)
MPSDIEIVRLTCMRAARKPESSRYADKHRQVCVGIALDEIVEVDVLHHFLGTHVHGFLNQRVTLQFSLHLELRHLRSCDTVLLNLCEDTSRCLDHRLTLFHCDSLVLVELHLLLAEIGPHLVDGLLRSRCFINGVLEIGWNLRALNENISDVGKELRSENRIQCVFHVLSDPSFVPEDVLGVVVWNHLGDHLHCPEIEDIHIVQVIVFECPPQQEQVGWLQLVLDSHAQ